MSQVTKNKQDEPYSATGEVVMQQPTGCRFRQVGTTLVCDGAGNHAPHAFAVPAHLVFIRQSEEGLVFKNLNTGEITTKILQVSCVLILIPQGIGTERISRNVGVNDEKGVYDNR